MGNTLRVSSGTQELDELERNMCHGATLDVRSAVEMTGCGHQWKTGHPFGMSATRIGFPLLPTALGKRVAFPTFPQRRRRSSLFKPASHQMGKSVTYVLGLKCNPCVRLYTPLGEVRKGVTILPLGARRTQLEKSIEEQVPAWFAGRILPVTQSIAERWGVLEGQRQLAGRPISVPDAQIAATALEHGLTVVTRNVKDFQGIAVAILSPWESV